MNELDETGVFGCETTSRPSEAGVFYVTSKEELKQRNIEAKKRFKEQRAKRTCQVVFWAASINLLFILAIKLGA